MCEFRDCSVDCAELNKRAEELKYDGKSIICRGCFYTALPVLNIHAGLSLGYWEQLSCLR